MLTYEVTSSTWEWLNCHAENFVASAMAYDAKPGQYVLVETVAYFGGVIGYVKGVRKYDSFMDCYKSYLELFGAQSVAVMYGDPGMLSEWEIWHITDSEHETTLYEVRMVRDENDASLHEINLILAEKTADEFAQLLTVVNMHQYINAWRGLEQDEGLDPDEEVNLDAFEDKVSEFPADYEADLLDDPSYCAWKQLSEFVY